MSKSTLQKLTLEEIGERKKRLLSEIQTQKQIIRDTVQEIFAPLAPAVNKADALMRSFNTGMAVFDGVMMGIKLMRRLRRFLRGFK